MPDRVQLSRAKGWRMPPNTVRVTRPTAWGNPFVVGKSVAPGMPPITDAATTVRCFEILVQEEQPATLNPFHIRAMLKGKNLACWCKLSEPCHADILLRIANSEPQTVGAERQ